MIYARIRKYQNEGIVLLGLVILLGGVVYEKQMAHALKHSLEQSRTAAQEIDDIAILQSVWSTKGLTKKVSALRRAVPKKNVKAFSQKKSKLDLHFVDMDGKMLNTVLSKIASLPLHMQAVSIGRSGEHYTLRCTCTW